MTAIQLCVHNEQNHPYFCDYYMLEHVVGWYNTSKLDGHKRIGWLKYK